MRCKLHGINEVVVLSQNNVRRYVNLLQSHDFWNRVRERQNGEVHPDQRITAAWGYKLLLIVARFSVFLPIPPQTATGHGVGINLQDIGEGKVKRDDAVAVFWRDEFLHIIARLAVGCAVPSVMVADLHRPFVVERP